MADAKMTNVFRQKLAAQLAGGAAAPAVTHVAFGDGGHDADNRPISPTGQNSLQHELLRSGVLEVTHPDAYSTAVVGRVERGELVGEVISEAALVDAAGDLVAVKSFAPSWKDADKEIDVEITIEF
jgi:phage-related tail fiber protein